MAISASLDSLCEFTSDRASLINIQAICVISVQHIEMILRRNIKNVLCSHFLSTVQLVVSLLLLFPKRVPQTMIMKHHKRSSRSWAPI